MKELYTVTLPLFDAAVQLLLRMECCGSTETAPGRESLESKKNATWNTETKRIGDQTMKDLRAYEDYLEDMTQNNAKLSRDDKWIDVLLSFPNELGKK